MAISVVSSAANINNVPSTIDVGSGADRLLEIYIFTRTEHGGADSHDFTVGGVDVPFVRGAQPTAGTMHIAQYRLVGAALDALTGSQALAMTNFADDSENIYVRVIQGVDTSNPERSFHSYYVSSSDGVISFENVPSEAGDLISATGNIRFNRTWNAPLNLSSDHILRGESGISGHYLATGSVTQNHQFSFSGSASVAKAGMLTVYRAAPAAPTIPSITAINGGSAVERDATGVAIVASNLTPTGNTLAISGPFGTHTVSLTGVSGDNATFSLGANFLRDAGFPGLHSFTAILSNANGDSDSVVFPTTPATPQDAPNLSPGGLEILSITPGNVWEELGYDLGDRVYLEHVSGGDYAPDPSDWPRGEPVYDSEADFPIQFKVWRCTSANSFVVGDNADGSSDLTYELPPPPTISVDGAAQTRRTLRSRLFNMLRG